MRALRVWLAMFATVAVVLAPLPTTSAARAAGPSGSCNVTLQFDELQIGPEGGAKIQEIVVNDDCSVTKGAVQVIEPGTAQFERFLADKGTTKANKKHHGTKPAAGALPPGDPECWTELDYQDVAWANLTQTRLGMPYLYDAGTSQITATYPLDWSTMAGTDGWYLIDQYTTPYSGPLPYGQINAYGQASFAWVLGSFWHQHQNNNYVPVV